MKFVLLLCLVTAKEFPYSKYYDYTAVKPDEKGYQMSVSISISQSGLDNPLMFGLTTAIYPKPNEFVDDNIYQSYVQLQGMSESKSYNNIVCNMFYSSKKIEIINSCGFELMVTLQNVTYD